MLGDSLGDVYVEVSANTDRIPEDIRRAVKKSEAQNAGDFNHAGQTGGKNFGAGFQKGLPKPQGFLQWTAASAGLLETITPVGKALEGLVAGTSAFLGVAGSASFATVTLADNFSSLLGVYGTTKIATMGMSSAFKAAAAAQTELNTTGKLSQSTYNTLHGTLNSLAPSAQAFVKQSLALGPAWKTVQKSVQQSFFSGLATDLKSVSNALLPTMNKQLTAMSGTLNDSAHGFAKFISSKEGVSEIDLLLTSMNEQMKILMPAAGNIAKALLNLWVGSSGPAQTMADSIGAMARNFNAWSVAVTNSGSWQRTLDRAHQSLMDMAGFLGSLGKLAQTFFGAGVSAGQSMLQNWTSNITTLNNFLHTLRGQQDLSKFYASIGQVGKTAHDIFGILNPVLKTAMDIFQAMSPFIQSMQQFLQPLLASVAKFVETLASAGGAQVLGPILAVGVAIKGFNILTGIVDRLAKSFFSLATSATEAAVATRSVGIGGGAGAAASEAAILATAGKRAGPSATLLEESKSLGAGGTMAALLGRSGIKGLGLGALAKGAISGPGALLTMLGLPLLTSHLGAAGAPVQNIGSNALLAGLFTGNPMAALGVGGATAAFQGIKGGNSFGNWAQTVGGGAATGAAVGSLLGPLGTGVGAAAGAALAATAKGLKDLFTSSPPAVKAIDQVNKVLASVATVAELSASGPLKDLQRTIAGIKGSGTSGDRANVGSSLRNSGASKVLTHAGISATEQVNITLGQSGATADAQAKVAHWQAIIDKLQASGVALNAQQLQQVKDSQTDINLVTSLMNARTDAHNQAVEQHKAEINQLAIQASVEANYNQAALQDTLARAGVAKSEQLAFDIAQGNVIRTAASIRDEALKLGLTQPQIKVLLSLLKGPAETDLHSTIDMWKKYVNGNPLDLLLNIVPGSGVKLQTSGNPNNPTSINPSLMNLLPSGNGKQSKAGGGLLRGAGTSTSDSIPVMGSNGEYMLRAAAVNRLGTTTLDYMNATGKMPLHRAGGGSIYDVAPTVKTKTSKSGSNTKKATTAVTVQEGAIFYLSDPQTEAKYGAAHGLVFSSNVAKGILAGNTTVINAVRTLGGKILATLDAQITKAQAKIDTIQQDYTSIQSNTTSALTGTSGIGQMNTFNGILGSLTKQNANTALFSKDLQLLEQKGLNKDMVRDLSSQGLNALPGVKALLSGGSAGIAKINSLQGSITKNAQTAGTKTAIYIDGKSLHDARAAIVPLQTEKKNVTLALQELDTHSPSAASKAKLSKMANSNITVNQNFFGPSTSSAQKKELEWALRYAVR